VKFFLNDGFMYLFDAFSSDSLKRFCHTGFVHTGKTDLIILKRINNHTHDLILAKLK